MIGRGLLAARCRPRFSGTPARAFAPFAVAAVTVAAGPAGAAPAGHQPPPHHAGAGASAWALQPTPNPRIKEGTLAAVSCASPSACTAVGSYRSVPGLSTLAERWNGTAWSIERTPNPRGASTSVLFAVSCPSATACVAVGNHKNGSGGHVMLAEAWDGTSWSIMPTPGPAKARRSFLFAVSCTSATDCVAVGSYQTAAGKHVTLAERWDGTSWSVQPTPNAPAAAGRSSLSGVSCVSASFCMAVGFSGDPNGATARPLAEAWDGARWSLKPPVPAPGSSSGLTGVSCPAAGACEAVGFRSTGTLAEAWNGTSWSIQRSPGPNGATPQFTGVSCVSASACEAVGSPGAFAERWNGTVWSLQPSPPGINVDSRFSGVSCASPKACAAAGTFSVGAGGEVPLAEVWDGTMWSIQTAPSPRAVPKVSQLLSVSCTSPEACTAVGDYNNDAGGIVTLAEQWNGTRWSIQRTPNPPGALDSVLRGVSCASPAACIAVGDYLDSSDRGFTLAEAWDGTSWSIQAAPNPPGGHLSSVSCTSPAACIAVGSTGSGTTRSGTLAEAWDGTSWSVLAAPSPPTSELDGVSCTSPSACTAVGSSAGETLTLAEAWNGTSWSIQPTPSPAGLVAGLFSVSCPSASACLAVGVSVDSSFTENNLAEAWNGSSWSIQPAPTGGSFTDVWCASATDCVAAGGDSGPLAAAWNGTSWSIQPTPSPGGSSAAGFETVSCTPAGACTAVGEYLNGVGTHLTLAEARH
jgi:hypothetical protein